MPRDRIEGPSACPFRARWVGQQRSKRATTGTSTKRVCISAEPIRYLDIRLEHARLVHGVRCCLLWQVADDERGSEPVAESGLNQSAYLAERDGVASVQQEEAVVLVRSQRPARFVSSALTQLIEQQLAQSLVRHRTNVRQVQPRGLSYPQGSRVVVVFLTCRRDAVRAGTSLFGRPATAVAGGVVRTGDPSAPARPCAPLIATLTATGPDDGVQADAAKDARPRSRP